MNPFAEYLMKNLFLLCLSFGVVFMVLQTHHSKKKMVTMPICIVTTAVVLSILNAVEEWANESSSLIWLATICSALGFMIRPLVLIFFINLVGEERPIIFRIAMVLIAINALIYLTSVLFFWDPVYKLAFYYNNDLKYIKGPLFFANHVITGAMVVYVIYRAITSLQGKHRYNAIASLICVAFIGFAVLIETLEIGNNLVNTMIAIACLFYVVHIYRQAGKHDPLTDLYNRGSFYDDVERFGSSVHSLALVDMNGLKPINDEQGHSAGDTALKTLASILDSCSDKKLMYIYRMGGDEFEVLNLSNDETTISKFIEDVQAELSKTSYTVSIGFAIREGGEDTVSKMTRRADKMMYENKALYYQQSGKERRKR